MNKLLLILALLTAVASSMLAQSSPATAPEETGPRTRVVPEPPQDSYPRWSVVGEWRVRHPVWKDVITLQADGTMITTRQQTTGRWILTGDDGTPLLVLRWDKFGTESLTMVTPNHLRGRTHGGFVDFWRGEESLEELGQATNR